MKSMEGEGEGEGEREEKEEATDEAGGKGQAMAPPRKHFLAVGDGRDSVDKVVIYSSKVRVESSRVESSCGRW